MFSALTARFVHGLDKHVSGTANLRATREGNSKVAQTVMLQEKIEAP
jgi:hypothetical protein